MPIVPYNKNCRLNLRLKNITIRLITTDECSKWNELMKEYHYLKNGSMVGPQLRYVAEIGTRAVALLGFSNASYHMTSRDNWIAWNDLQRDRRLGFVIQNSRFLILPDAHKKNMASKVLALCVQKVAKDWEQQFRQQVLVIETFTELDGVRRGTGYSAAGWVRVGETKGYRKDKEKFYTKGSTSKGVWCKEVFPGARELLSSEMLPEKYRCSEKKSSLDFSRRKLASGRLYSLFEVLRLFDVEPRKRGQRYLSSSCLAAVFCGVFAGCKGMRECAEFVSSFSQAQLGAMGMWMNPMNKRYKAPSYVTIWRTIASVDPMEFENRVLTWFNNEMKGGIELIHIDGKTLRATIEENQKGIHVVTAASIGEKKFASNFN